MSIKRIVIIGAGECGVRAAFALREHTFKGEIVLLSAESELPYERPPLSKTPWNALKPIRVHKTYDDAGIELRLGAEAIHIDTQNRQIALKDGQTLGYDRLLLATGASARLFPGMEGCVTLRTNGDAQTIAGNCQPGARIGIVGGGFIGLELAAAARKAGAEVELFEAAPRLLGRAVPEAIASIVQARHEAEGVKIFTSASVTRAGDGKIHLNDGSLREFDVVIAGVGAFPNTTLAEQAGLETANGIVVDEFLRTSDPHIHAAGDCCNFPWRGNNIRLESWRAAQDQGEHVAATMLGVAASYDKVPWFWSDQYDMTLQVAGLFDSRLSAHARTTPDECSIVFQCTGSGQLSAAAGIGPGNAVARDLRILEKLIERQAVVDPAMLADVSQNLKRLLKSA